MTSTFALRTLLALVLVAWPARGLEIRTYVASELGFLVSSHLVLGETEALLVDAQFTRSEAADVAALVRASRRRLTTIFITHGRPAHYLGLEVLRKSFPEARVLARPATVEAIREGAATAILRWQPIYLDDLPGEVVLPEPFAAEALAVDGVEIRLLDLGEGRRARPTLLYVPSEGALLASDLAAEKVHLLAAEPGDAWPEGLRALAEERAIARVYPGHGSPGGPELLRESTEYSATLRAALIGGPSPGQVVEKMREAYPEHRLPILLEQRLKEEKRLKRR